MSYLLAYACTLATREADEALRRHGLTLRQFGLLMQLRTEPELTMSELAGQLDVSRQARHEMVGVRLDSGDLAYLSIEARKILDAGGFPNARVLASNDLDEHVAASLKEQGARIDTWGVGTRLVTAYDQPALGGVYKLSALRGDDGKWQYKLKLSEQTAKVSNPGVLQVRRYRRADEYVADAIYDLELGADVPQWGGGDGACTIVDPMDPTRRKAI